MFTETLPAPNIGRTRAKNGGSSETNSENGMRGGAGKTRTCIPFSEPVRPPTSGDRTRSPSPVSRIWEFSTAEPETPSLFDPKSLQSRQPETP